MDGHDDPVAGRRAGVACDWLYRHAAGVSLVGLAGPADSSARSAERPSESLPSDLAAAHAMILAERHARLTAEANAAAAATNAAVARAEAANAQADLSSSEALIAHLKLAIEKLRRELYGTRSERAARLLDHMELPLEDLEAARTEDGLMAETAAERDHAGKAFPPRGPSARPGPGHRPRERI